MVSKGFLESASIHNTTLALTDFAAISAEVGPCFSFLPTFYQIDPAVPMLVNKLIVEGQVDHSLQIIV